MVEPAHPNQISATALPAIANPSAFFASLTDITLITDPSLPLLIRPHPQHPIDLLDWIAHYADPLQALLHQQGAILFRDFGLQHTEAFTTLAQTLCPNLHLEYGDLAEVDSSLGVYASTPYPNEQTIHLHNEGAPAGEWPLYLFFFCEQPALAGGTTQLVDTRKVLTDLPPDLYRHLQQHSLTYTRNHYPHVDTSWQKLYGTTDPRQVEQYCQERGIEFCWTQRDTLQTQMTVPPILSHPITGEAGLFHQLFLFHPSCLDPETAQSLEKLYHPSEFPRFVTWSNQLWIDDKMVQSLFALYQKHRVDLRWQLGDVLLLDNAIMAHGRSPFQGQRKLLIAMGHMVQNAPVPRPKPAQPGISNPDPTLPFPKCNYHPVHQEFDAVAGCTPDAIAISQDESAWTYRELKQQALQVVAVLQAHGVRPGATVAVTGSRCFELIAAILGIWMNGQVILLVDPLLPAMRQAGMLQESKAEFLFYIDHCGLPLQPEQITRDHLKLLPDQCDLDPATSTSLCPKLDLKTLSRDAPEAISLAISLPVVRADAPAYIFFTSGTTGKPKGILGSHQGLAHFLNWQRDQFGVSAGDRIAQLTSISFDVVLRDLFLPLISGATVCLPPADLDFMSPWQWFEQAQITRLHAVPSLASLWLENAPSAVACDRLKTVFFAGEPLTDTLVRHCRSRLSPSVEIINLYGPTETTLAKCWYAVPAVPKLGVQSIGHPLPDVQILIMNEQQELCEYGTTGEIVIRTPYRTLGYLQADPETDSQTDSASHSTQAVGFVANPFSTHAQDDSDRLYYTGDLGRYHRDGTLEILGRKDDQIKILGVRIDPQEIVACLVGHPSIQQAFVAVHSVHNSANDQSSNSGKDANGDRTKNLALVAFIVADPQILPEHELLSYLGDRLPLALIPRQFVYLTQMPLTSNGKVDRKALLALCTPAQRSISSVCAPRTATEAALSQIWLDILHCGAIAVQDNFFHLGGHSLLAMQVIAKIREQFHVPMEIQHIFENPTIATLATSLDQMLGQVLTAAKPSNEPDQVLQSPALQISPQPRDNASAFPLSFAQESLWFLSQMEPEKGVYNIPGAIRFHGCVDRQLLQTCLDTLVERHTALRTYFVEAQGVCQQKISDHAQLVLDEQDLSQALSSLSSADRLVKVKQVAQRITRSPFPLTQAPLARATLLKVSDRESVLVYALHHTIADGWSNLIFNRELQQCYVAKLQGQSIALPELAVDHVDYAGWEQQHFQKSGHQQVAFWQNDLSDAPPYLHLPLDRPRPPIQTFNGAASSLTLSTDLTHSLKQAFPKSSATLFLKLLTIFQILLSQYTGDRDIVIGTPIAHRQDSRYASVMGCLINTLPIRIVIPEDCAVIDLLDITRTHLLSALTHQDVPFTKIVEAVQPPRDPSYHPIFQVLFNYLAFEEPASQLPEIFMHREWLVEPETKFDLTLYIREKRSHLHLHLVYNLDLFEPQTMEQLLRHYQQLLEQAVLQPHQSLLSLPGIEKLGLNGDRCSHLASPNLPSSHLALNSLALPKSPQDVCPTTLKALAAIWKEMLKIDRVQPDDNFFALGGYSLLAVQLIARIQQAFGITIPLRSLFTHPTLAELSQAIAQNLEPDLKQNPEPDLKLELDLEKSRTFPLFNRSPIMPGDYQGLSLDQERLWQLHQVGADQYYFNVPRAIRLCGDLDLDRLRDAIGVVLQRHSILRSVYGEQPGQDQPGQGQFKVLPVEHVPLEVINLTALSVEQRNQQEKQIIDREASYRFDLTCQFPLRLTLLQHSEQEHSLIMTAHHIAVDCWSLGLPFQAIFDQDTPWHPGIFLTELLQIYQNLVDGLPNSLPALPIQFSDFAYWQRQQLQQSRFQEDADFWYRQLHDAPKKIDLPTDFDRPPAYTLAGVRSEFSVPTELSTKLEQLRREHRTTLFVPLLSAFSIAMHQWTGATDLVIGTPVSNRNLPEIQQLIGPIANTVVLRIQVDKTQSASTLIEQVRVVTEQSFAHQEYPFTQLVKDLNANLNEENASYPPVFQLRFVLQQSAEKVLDFTDLAVSPIQFDRGVSKYDLSLIMVAQGKRLRGWCEYNTALFQASTIQGWTQLYLRILQHLLQNSSQTVGDIVMTRQDCDR